MSFRARIAVAAAVAVALAVALASVLAYVAVRAELRGQVDETLRRRAAEIARVPLAEIQGPGGHAYLGLHRGFGEASTYVQLVKADGTILRQPLDRLDLPASDDALALANEAVDTELLFEDARVGGTHVRVLSVAYGPGYVVQIARSLAEADDALARLRVLLGLVALGGIGLAGGLGLAVSGAALAPVRRLTGAAERVSATGDLSERIAVDGRDELSRLAGSFNAMLGALESSRRAQRQLVADASHELRTPLTSLRTNIEVLAGDHSLPPGERERLLADVVEQLDEMTTLVAELIELARAEQQALVSPSALEPVRLDAVAADALARARRNRPGVRFQTDLAPSVVRGIPEALERAIGNLLDNAAKWSPPEGEVSVHVARGRVVVRDRGPGIADEDLAHVFDRFYRARNARGLPGSGLGLAIVRQVAEAHGGAVSAERAEGGGTRIVLELPELATAGSGPRL
ncbi:MAG TPA: HAMP domain-containing sensor histidine kinase [Gaiellaceae bacterium]|nr:HAMP domain-containing sensor histidine kinase [Gaiellaceae bacterium]